MCTFKLILYDDYFRSWWQAIIINIWRNECCQICLSKKIGGSILTFMSRFSSLARTSTNPVLSLGIPGLCATLLHYKLHRSTLLPAAHLVISFRSGKLIVLLSPLPLLQLHLLLLLLLLLIPGILNTYSILGNSLTIVEEDIVLGEPTINLN